MWSIKNKFGVVVAMMLLEAETDKVKTVVFFIVILVKVEVLLQISWIRGSRDFRS